MTKSSKTNTPGTGLDLRREKIMQFSLVVKDRDKVAKRFSRIFGVPWKLYELNPGKIILQGKEPRDTDCRLKLAIGNFGGRSLKLIQPVSGQSAYAEFLENYGEGFYTIGLGTVPNHKEIVSALLKAGINLEMQGNVDGAEFSIMDTVEDLGCRIEFSAPACNRGNTNIRQTGTLMPDGSGIVNLEKPLFSGGKRINQVGLVVKDERKAAKRFGELLGIRNWAYAYGPPGLSNAFLNEKPVPESEMQSLDVAFAMGELGDIQIEIIRPIGLRPGGCHQVFLDKRGNGIQHVSFGIQPDYGEFVDGMKAAGIGVEFSASIKTHGVSATYFACQDQLGGFQLEIVGKT
jgi:catechol 2,3-dioxygenase-like lactoylglutathione lyase family enzyme